MAMFGEATGQNRARHRGGGCRGRALVRHAVIVAGTRHIDEGAPREHRL